MSDTAPGGAGATTKEDMMGHQFAAAILADADEYREQLESRWLEVLDIPTPEEAKSGSWKPEAWHGVRARVKPATLPVMTELEKLGRRAQRASEESNAKNLKDALASILKLILIELEGIEPQQLAAAVDHIAERYPRMVWKLGVLSRELAAGALDQIEDELGNSDSSPGGPTV